MKIWPFTRKSDTKAITSADLDDLVDGGMTAAGIYVSPSDALRVPAVAAAVALISEAVATLDVTIKRIDGGTEIDVPDHPALPLLRDDACEWVSGFEAIRQIVIDALTSDQGGMLWVNRVAGRPVELIRYNPGVLTFERDVNTSERLYRRFGSIIPARDVVHLLPPLGRAPLSLARDAIGTAVALDRHVASLFANGARPSGLLKIPAQGPDQVKAARKVWNETHGGQESGRTAILINNTDFVPLTMTSTDGQHLENRRFQIEEIARAFNMSPVLLGEAELRTNLIKVCPFCGNEFKATRPEQVYCDRGCYRGGVAARMIPCLECGTLFRRQSHRSRYCSLSCASRANWAAGKTRTSRWGSRSL